MNNLYPCLSSPADSILKITYLISLEPNKTKTVAPTDTVLKLLILLPHQKKETTATNQNDTEAKAMTQNRLTTKTIRRKVFLKDIVDSVTIITNLPKKAKERCKKQA